MGTATGAIVLLVAVLTLGLPSGAVTHGTMFGAAGLVFLFYMLAVLVLTQLIKPRPHERIDSEQEAESWLATARVKSRLDLLLDMLWCCLAILPMFAVAWSLFNLSDAKLSDTESDTLTVMWLLAMVLVLSVGALFVPDLLHRWARPKAPPTPSPPEQAGSGQERQP
jgi:hypothetical protein